MLKLSTGNDQSVQSVTCAICGKRVTFVIVKSVSSVRLVISTSKYGRSSVAAGPTVTSHESSLFTVEGEAANADVAIRSSRIDRLFIVVVLRPRIDVRAGAEIGRAVRQRRSGQTDEDTAGRADRARVCVRRPDECGRCASVAERRSVELGDQPLRPEIAEHRDRYPVLARTRTDCCGAFRCEEALAASTGDDRLKTTEGGCRDRVAGAAAVVEVEVHPAADIGARHIVIAGIAGRSGRRGGEVEPGGTWA